MNKFSSWLLRKARLTRRERGFGLVETLVAIALLGVLTTGFISALSTGSLAVGEHDLETTAQQLAQAQMESIKAAAYDISGAGYPEVTVPGGYSVGFTVNSAIYSDNNIQKITITVSRSGTPVLVSEGYKVNR